MTSKKAAAYTALHHDSEAEWLEQRREVVTATDVARLAQGPSAARTIRREKDGEETFSGNRFTEWGNHREPWIGAWAGLFLGGSLIPNNELLISTKDARWAATPDMISADGSTLAEIKVSKNAWTKGEAPLRYLDQVQWQLMVTGAEKCFLICEPYEIIDGRFVPDQPFAEEITPDTERQDELVALAEKFLDGEETVDESVAEEMGGLVTRDVELSRRIKELGEEQKALRESISQLVGDEPVSIDLEFATVTRTRPSTTRRFDQTRFKKDHPDMVDEYTATTERAGTLRIVEAKPDDNEDEEA